MNSLNEYQEELNQSRRHRSVINPSMENIQILESNIISNNQNNILLNKMKLRSNSLFAYQEFDNYYTSFFEKYNLEKTLSSTYNSSFSNSLIEEVNFSQNSKKEKSRKFLS